MQRTGYNPAFDERLRAAANGQPGLSEVPQFAQPQVANSTNDFAARKQLENLATSASSITNTVKWGGRGVENNPSARDYRVTESTGSKLSRLIPSRFQIQYGLPKTWVDQDMAQY